MAGTWGSGMAEALGCKSERAMAPKWVSKLVVAKAMESDEVWAMMSELARAAALATTMEPETVPVKERASGVRLGSKYDLVMVAE